MTGTAKRHLSPFEKNHLLRHGFDPEKIDKYGEMPVEYIAGWAEFLGREFSVTPDVLIPRVETEELVEMIVKDPSLRAKDHLRGIEIGTGSGAIGASLAIAWENDSRLFELIVIDISASALQQARANFQTHVSPSTLEAVVFHQGDLFEGIPAKNQFDFVVANLPYIPSERMAKLDASVREFEPHLALDGGPDGTTLIARLLDQAPQYLKPDAKIFLEVDDTHTPEIWKAIAPDYSVQTFRDQFGKNRFAVCQLTAP